MIKSTVYFADEKLKESYFNLQNSTAEEKLLFKWISKAIADLEQNAFCGLRIPKRLIPDTYENKYKITNLWKINLPQGWRLLYTIGKEEVIIRAIILEWMHHKDYERRFNY